VVAAVAGEGEEVDLVAVAHAAVLPQVGELRRAHTSGGARSAPSGRAEPVTASAAAASAREMLPAPRHRQAGRGREEEIGGGRLGRQADWARNRIKLVTFSTGRFCGKAL